MAFPVRIFKANNSRFTLLMDIEDNDTTKVIDIDGNEIGVKFDHSTNVYFKDKIIGRLRRSFAGEKPNIQFIKYNDDKTDDAPFDTGINEELVECYLDAETVVTRYLIEQGIIKLGE